MSSIDFEMNRHPASRLLEIGTPELLGFAGTNASHKTSIETGLNRIFNRTGSLTDNFYRLDDIEWIRPFKRENRAGIVTFSIEGLEVTVTSVENPE